ncbi:MAG: ABC transporter ATP-binding protein [Planctomycetaceae bacterium]|nr:ABC transporter ATP-binding protein [Planctomycetaceae bacterium]
MQLSEPIIQLKNLMHEHRNPYTDTLFRVEIDELTIERGDFAIVEGANGSGKSTFQNILATLLQPTAVTEYHLLGMNLTAELGSERSLGHIRRRLIGCAPQQPELLPALTVEENVALPLRLNGRTATTARVQQILEGFGCRDAAGRSDLVRLARHRPHQLSGGQAQRVGLARAVAHWPGILFCDEATSNLDPLTKKSTLRFLDQLRREENLTIVMVTHDAAVAPFATVRIQLELQAEGFSRLSRCHRRPQPSVSPFADRSTITNTPHNNGVQP